MHHSPNASQDAYPYLRQCLAPQFADADAESIESFMDQRFGLGAAEHYDAYLEGFFDDLGRTFQRVAPMVANVAGGMVSGAGTGAQFGLPGIIAGAVAGGAGRALSSYGQGPVRDVGNVLNTGMQVASQFSPMGRIGNQVGSTLSGLGQGPITPQRLLQQGGQLLASAGQGGMGGRAAPALAALGGLMGQGGGGAAGQLSSLLGRPEVQQALMALNLGPVGRSTVPVGAAHMPMPTTAIAGLLQQLSGMVASEAAAWSDGAESDLAYMADAHGEFVGDPAEEDDRAARVWDLLNQAQLERLATLAMQPRPALRRMAPPPLPEDWRTQFTEDLLAGLGEFEGEAHIEHSEAEAEAWGDETAIWTMEASHDYR